MEILSHLWSFLGLLTVLQNILPTQFLTLLNSLHESLQDFITPFAYFDIPEFNSYCSLDLNQLYRHVSLYLNSTAAPNHSVHDTFNGQRFTWTHHVETVQDSLHEKRNFSLRFPKRHRHALLPLYLDHVTSTAAESTRTSRERRLFTNSGAGGSYDPGWVSVPFRHPANFKTLALETELKKQIVQDLTAFAAGKEFYGRVGRSWKRGYFLLLVINLFLVNFFCCPLKVAIS